MHRARQEAGDGHGAGARVPAQPDGTVTETVVDIDADGRLAAVRGRGSARDYAALFAPADRSRGLPAELMRLARRPGLVGLFVDQCVHQSIRPLSGDEAEAKRRRGIRPARKA